MKKKSVKKSIKTRERIKQIKADLKSYRNTIQLLDSFADGSKVLKGKNYSEYAISYQRTAEDDDRYRCSRKNILVQIAFLEHELVTLMKYGA